MEEVSKFRVGDIFAIKLKRRNVYFIVQILDSSDKPCHVALVLDSFTKEIPTLDVIKNLKPFYLDHHFWEKQEFYLLMSVVLNEESIFLGNIIPIKKISEKIEWLQDIKDMYIQLAWNDLPKDIRLNFKNICKLPIPRVINISKHKNKDFYKKLARNSSFCNELTSIVWDDNLREFLEQTPLITDVELKTTDKNIDISHTFIQSLTIDVSNTENIILNNSLMYLTLTDNLSNLKSIKCPFNGEFLSLTFRFTYNISFIQGLEKVKTLHLLSSSEYLDLLPIALSFPKIREFYLSGGNRKLKDINALAYFKYLQNMHLADIYGFDGFPKKNELPYLKTLCLHCIPKTA